MQKSNVVSNSFLTGTSIVENIKKVIERVWMSVQKALKDFLPVGIENKIILEVQEI